MFPYWKIAFDFSEEIDGSANFYTINYTDSTFGTPCASVKIPVSSCVHDSCEHVLKRTSLAITCPSTSNITVTVFGTNRLGIGPPLNSTFTGTYSYTVYPR